MISNPAPSPPDREADNPQPLSEPSQGFLRRILALFILLALAYSLVVPFGEPTDEPAHYNYIRYLRDHRRLPVQSPDLADNPVDEGHHPPGYYAFVALLTGWAPYGPYPLHTNPYLPEGREDPQLVQQFLREPRARFPWPGPIWAAHLARLVSIALSALSVAATYHVAREAAPGAPAVAWLAAGCHAFLPQFLYMSGAINNDNGATLLGALMTWQMLRLLRAPDARGFAGLGALLGLGVLTKVSLLAMAPAIGWTVAWAAYHHAGTWRARAKSALWWSACVGLPALALAGWWAARNLRLYGDPLAWNIWMQSYARFARTFPITPSYALRFTWQQFRTFWGLFGWSRVLLPTWLYLLWLGVTVMGAFGLGKRLWKQWQRRRDLHAEQIARLLLLAAICGGFLLSTWRLGLKLDITAAQGRFLFPALSALATLFALGWMAWELPRGARSYVGAAFALAGGVLLFRLAPVHSLPPIYPTAPSEAQRVAATFEPWELAGWQAPSPRAGRSWPLTLYWRAARALTAEERALAPIQFAHLVDVEGEALAKWDGVPTEGRLPPPAWSPTTVVADRLALSLPEASAPRLAYLQIGLYYQENGAVAHIPAESATHPTTPGAVQLGPVLVRPSSPPQADPAHPTSAHFGPIRLRGYDLARDPAHERLELTLTWEAEATLPTDYTVFVHLVGSTGEEEARAQGDAPPCGGHCPTSLWESGDLWRDQHQVATAALTEASAPYRLIIGWYNPLTGARLSAADGAGRALPNDQLLLCTFGSWPEGSCE